MCKLYKLYRDIGSITDVLASFPKEWDGKECILEMKEAGYPHWRQMEWIGFYFQFLCDKNLKKTGMQIPGCKFGRAEFDGHLSIDWDFKAHPMHDKNGNISNELIANDLEATYMTIDKNGKTGLIVAFGEADFDNPVTKPFRAWFTDLKGGESAYSRRNAERGASQRLYKTKFILKHVDIYILDHSFVDDQGRFQEGMRNSNGNPRRPKLSIDLSSIEPEKRIDF